MNYRVVDKEIFPIDEITRIMKKFKTEDYAKVHIKKINSHYWEARYLNPVKEEK